MADRDPAVELQEVRLELRDRLGSPEVAWDLCNSFLVRLLAGMEVTTSRIDYYLARVLSHEDTLKAASDFAKVFGVDVSFHTDLEDYCESILLDAARISAARDSVRDLTTTEVEQRAVSMRALVATLFRQPGHQPVKEGVRWLRRNSAVWVAPPYAFGSTALWDEKTWAVGRRAQPSREEPDLEDGYASDSALECRRGGRNPYRSSAAAASSTELGRGSSSSSASSSGSSSSSSPDLPSSRSPEAAAGPSTAAEPASDANAGASRRSRRRLGGDDGAGSPRSEQDRSYFERLPSLQLYVAGSFRRDTSPSGLLRELWQLHSQVCDALQEHVGRLAVLTSRSERRARQLGGAYREVSQAEGVLRADLETAATDARTELTKCRRQLQRCVWDAREFEQLMAETGRRAWWCPEVSAGRRPLGERLSKWWSGMRRTFKEAGDHREDIMVSRLNPPLRLTD